MKDIEMFYGAKPKIFELANKLRENMTEAENVLWEFLRLKKMAGIKFRRQHPIKFYIVDFYCHKFKLAVEVDGGIHDNPDQKAYDKDREKISEGLGISMLRFTNSEVLNSTESVLSIIEETINSLEGKFKNNPMD